MGFKLNNVFDVMIKNNKKFLKVISWDSNLSFSLKGTKIITLTTLEFFLTLIENYNSYIT